jgi:hypothetical protein
MSFFTVISRGKTKEGGGGLVPWTGTRVKHFLRAFQDKGDHQEGILSCPQKLGDVLNRWQAQVNQDTGHLYELHRQLSCFDSSIVSNPVHPCAGFIQFHWQVAPIGMAPAAL